MDVEGDSTMTPTQPRYILNGSGSHHCYVDLNYCICTTKIFSDGKISFSMYSAKSISSLFRFQYVLYFHYDLTPAFALFPVHASFPNCASFPIYT